MTLEKLTREYCMHLLQAVQEREAQIAQRDRTIVELRALLRTYGAAPGARQPAAGVVETVEQA